MVPSSLPLPPPTISLLIFQSKSFNFSISGAEEESETHLKSQQNYEESLSTCYFSIFSSIIKAF